MISLKKIFESVIQEQEDPSASAILQFPKQHFSVSVDKQKRQFIFTPDPQGDSKEMRPIILMMKRNFNVSSVKAQEDTTDPSVSWGDEQEVDLETQPQQQEDFDGVLVVELDPRENVDKVVEFLSAQAQ